MFSLHVQTAQWRSHLRAVVDRVPDLVPVAKGNGYGFGMTTLATEAEAAGCRTLAVGAFDELPLVYDAFRGDVLVLTPWHPAVDADPAPDARLIVTASASEAVLALAQGPHRVVVELLTSMRRFGLDEDALARVAPALDTLPLEGFALHLPIDDGDIPRCDEVSSWVNTLRRHQLSTRTLWVSHVSDAELTTLRRRHPETVFRPRVGTDMWLGQRSAYQAKGTVLAVHAVHRGQRFGYRQRRTGGEGHLLVVGGGTSHGVALAAPRAVRGLTARIKRAGEGTLEAGGRALSPFHVAGRRRWFAEPPHMQVSMIWLPAGVQPPGVGAELPADMRMTTATFDQVVLH